jgi:hypothetical protein
MDHAFPNRLVFECLANRHGLSDRGFAAVLRFHCVLQLIDLGFDHIGPRFYGDSGKRFLAFDNFCCKLPSGLTLQRHIQRVASAKIQDQPPHFRRVSAKTGLLTPVFSGERASSSCPSAKSRKPRRRAPRPSKHRSRCCCQTPCPPKTETATHRSGRARFSPSRCQ